MEKILTDILTVAMLVLGGGIIGAIVFGVIIKNIIAAQPAPVIHNTATASAGGSGGSGNGIGIGAGPLIIGGLLGLVLALWASTGFKTGQVSPAAIPMSQPVAVPVAAPVLQPTAVKVPVEMPNSVPTTPIGNGTPADYIVVYVLLAVAVIVILFDVIGMLVLQRRKRALNSHAINPIAAFISVGHQAADRMQRIDDILPDAVMDLEE